ncbi:MAG: hypothetical protein EOO22_21025 [Comamonadaceae bacterium]|nr:MAG: hypothetical protein EOO22_21025 [Comamonadaceae bacterium]
MIVFKLGKKGTIEQVPYVKMSGFRKALHILSGRAMFNKEAAKCYVRAIEEKLKAATYVDSDMQNALNNIKKELKLHPMTYGISSMIDYTLRSKLGETVDP